MKIAVPLDKKLFLYNDNPYTASKFAIYAIEGNKTNITFNLLEILDNPRHINSSNKLEKIQKSCACDKNRENNMQHICEHYSILETIKNCNYLLASEYCKNTYNALKNGGVKIFKIPKIIKKTDIAINNFLIGARYANTIQDIHYVS